MDTGLRSVHVPWAQALVVLGLLIAVLGAMTLASDLDRAGRIGTYTVGGLGLAVAGVGVAGLAAQRRRALVGLRAADGTQRARVLLMALLLALSLVLAILPLRGVWAWVGVVPLVLALGCALWIALRMAGDASAAVLRQAAYARRGGDVAGAVALLESEIERRPASVAPRYALAGLLRERGDLAQALTQARELVRLRGDLYYGHAEEGLALLAQGRTDSARSALERAATAAPGLPEAHLNLGLACAEGGDDACAIDHLARALRLGLRDGVAALIARHGLWRALEAQGRQRDADRELRRLRRQRRVLADWRAELEEERRRGAAGPGSARDRRLAGEIAESLARP